MVANNLYWSTSQATGDTTYPVIHMLHKDAIIRHPFMLDFSKKFALKHFDTDMDMAYIKDFQNVLNSVQAEEMRFAKSIMCLGSHYSELVYDSKAQSKLEALDVLDNIVKSLRVLWQADLGCRKIALGNSS